MGLNSEDPILIHQTFTGKVSPPPGEPAHKHICNGFSMLMREARCIVNELKRRAKPSDKDVTVEIQALELGGAQKIGFRMSYEQKTEG